MNKYYTIKIEHKDGSIDELYTQRSKALAEYEKAQIDFPKAKVFLITGDEIR